MIPAKIDLPRLLVCLLVVIHISFSCSEAAEGTKDKEIVSVALPFRLFSALATYQELSQAEKDGERTGTAIIPVLENIIHELKDQYRLHTRSTLSDAFRERLDRLAEQISCFERELELRRKRLEAERLLERQRSIIEGELP